MVQPAEARLLGKLQIRSWYMTGFCGCSYVRKTVRWNWWPAVCLMTNVQAYDFNLHTAVRSVKWFVLTKTLRLSVRFLTYLFDCVFQLPDRFKFAPEMEGYIDEFLNSCDDPERQLAVLIGFSTLTNQGYPVLSSSTRVVRHLQPVALQKYVDWLKDMFLSPDFDCCLDFSSNRQKQNREKVNKWVYRWCTFLFSFCFVVRVAIKPVWSQVWTDSACWFPCYELTVVACSVSSVLEGLTPASDSFAETKFNLQIGANTVRTSQPDQSRLDHQRSLFSCFSSHDICFGKNVQWLPFPLQSLGSL